MFISRLLALATSIASVSAVYQGFNYGSTFTDGSALNQSDFENEFTTAQNLVGISGFTSARLYTMVQAGTANDPISAIPAAINTKTFLLLGLWASAGKDVFNNEVIALTTAIKQYGTNFTDLIAGISVGSEDLYRNSPIGIENLSGIGANPADIVGYISQVRSAIAGTTASGAPVGHVDTWTAWVNGSNNPVIEACDFVGVDAYPYFQSTMANSIDVAYDLFFQAYNNTAGAAGAKPVWVTETGWPVSGPNKNLGVANVQNAQTYWDEVGCNIFGKINTWWYTLRDSFPTTPSPSFGIVGTQLSTSPLFNLTCPAIPYKPSSSNLSPNGTISPSSNTSSSGSSPSSTKTSGAGSKAMFASGAIVGVIAIAVLIL